MTQLAAIRQLGPPPARARLSPARREIKSTKTAKPVEITIAGIKLEDIEVPALKPEHAEAAKTMNERVYPLIFIFENSVRNLIERMLEDANGPSWWTTVVPSKVRETNDLNVSRRVLAHMNLLSDDDIGNIENAFRKWTKQLLAVQKLIP